jgi:hypothetical protein
MAPSSVSRFQPPDLVRVPRLTPCLGETRVWTHPADREHFFQTLIHTHLNQSVGFSHALALLSNSGVGKPVVVPLTFVLPELSTESKDSNFNGRMPPSCELGSLYVDPWGRTHMQPLIEYSLQVTLRYRLAGETAIRFIFTKHKIKVATAPHCDPPAYSQSVLAVKAAAASADLRRSRLAKPFARLEISMAEPGPVVRNGVGGSCRTTGQLRLTWETSSDAYDEFELGKRSAKIEYWLQARTRFGARAIGPDSKATDGEARPNKRVKTTLLGTFEVRSMDRDDVHLAGLNGRRCHTGTIPIPVQVADGTIPTFSHCLASRDYVLLVKVEVQGMQHKALSIRVPVQVCESVVEAKCSSPQNKSSIYADMLSSEVGVTMPNGLQIMHCQ